MSAIQVPKRVVSHKRRPSRTAPRRPSKRRGAAVVEFAVCLPLLVFMTLAFIDLTNFIYFRQSLKIAAYDAARAASEPGATTSDVETAAGRLLETKSVDNWSLTLPDNFATLTRGDLIELELSAPVTELTQFSAMEFWQGAIGSTVTVEIAAVKE